VSKNKRERDNYPGLSCIMTRAEQGRHGSPVTRAPRVTMNALMLSNSSKRKMLFRKTSSSISTISGATRDERQERYEGTNERNSWFGCARDTPRMTKAALPACTICADPKSRKQTTRFRLNKARHGRKEGRVEKTRSKPGRNQASRGLKTSIGTRAALVYVPRPGPVPNCTGTRG